MKKYLLELIVFICGAIVMIFELVGSRVLAPYLGTSLFVWTSLIGVILGSLSLGYFLGGKLSLVKLNYETLAAIIFVGAALIAVTTIFNKAFLSIVVAFIPNIRIEALVASLILFAGPSIALGMVSPYTVRLRIINLETSGSTVGNLYAISTIGSIVGTFAAGFFLIPLIGTIKILYLLSIILFLTSILAYSKNMVKQRLIGIGMLLIFLTGSIFVNTVMHKMNMIDTDTSYSRITIFDMREKNGQLAKHMMIDNENSSAMYLNSDELVFDYTKFYSLANHFNPNIKNALTIGGAAYTFPTEFLKTTKDTTMDVVEIDPGLTALAKKYFRLSDNPRLTIYHEDGRVFLNRTLNKYDAIFGDAFKAYSPPYQLTTIEAVTKMYSHLNDHGVVFANIISAVDGEKGKFLRAEYATFLKVFPQVYIFGVKTPDRTQAQNLMLVALKSPQKPAFESSNPTYNQYLSQLIKDPIALDMPILTDDFAPVENYIRKTL